MSTPCDVDITQLDLYNAFYATLDCMRWTYRKLIAKSTVEPVHRIAAAIASRLAAEMATPYVIETPRRIEFTTRLRSHRVAPLPTIGIVAPRSVDGVDFPIRYDAWPTATLDPRRLVSDYVDALKDFAERGKKNIIIVRLADGTENTHELKSPKHMAATMGLANASYYFSYDRDYPPADPPTIYVEGMAYFIEVPNVYGVTIIEANVLAYQTVAGDYYSGFGGVVIYFVDYANSACELRAFGRTFDLSEYSNWLFAASNLFTMIQYIKTTTAKGC